MPKKVYLIDTENVKSEWKSILDKLGKNDRLLIFYTENSPNVSFADFSNLVHYPFQYEMIPCFLGKNGLDFQLVTYLGYLLRRYPFREYVILSNDTGFDAVVYFWSGKGKKVSRLSTQSFRGDKTTNSPKRSQRKARTLGPKKKENGVGHQQKKDVKVLEKKPIVHKTNKKRSKEKIQQDTTLKLKEILAVQKGIDFSWLYGELQIHGIDDLQELNRAMTKKWGQDEGTALYKKLKPRIQEVYDIMKE